MGWHGATPTSGETALRVGSDELRLRYAAYRARHAARLVQMMPREAIRPLYRRALRDGRQDTVAEDDPLARLVGYCESLLPLPSFEIWRQDLLDHPDAHLADLDESAYGPTADAPATVEVRALDFGGRRWLAHLRSFRDAGLWRGFMAFEDQESGLVHRTAPVFCEVSPGQLRERFLSFESTALEAFLRSTLP